MSPLDRLLARSDVRPNPAASDADIAAAEGRLGLTLPEPVRELYRRANGALVGRNSTPFGRTFDFLTLAEAGPYAESLDRALGSTFGYFPLTEANDSDPVCVACRSPLTGHIVHVFHDDDPRLLFRSFDEFAAAVPARLDAGGRLEGIPSPFDGPDRTDEDRRLGREVLAFADGLDPDGSGQVAAHHFAFALLDPADPSVIAHGLTHPDEYVRYAAENRLRAIGTPAALAAVGAYRRSVADFCRRVVTALRAAGIEVVLEQQPGGLALLYGSRRRGLNHVMFYRLRDEPDGMVRIVERVRQLLALDADR